MSFKYKVFWINSTLSEARKVNLTILKIKLFSNTKCLKNALFDKLLDTFQGTIVARRKRRRKKIVNNQINKHKLNTLNELITVTSTEYIYIYTITSTKSLEGHINIMKQSPLSSI